MSNFIKEKVIFVLNFFGLLGHFLFSLFFPPLPQLPLKAPCRTAEQYCVLCQYIAVHIVRTVVHTAQKENSLMLHSSGDRVSSVSLTL